MTDYCTTSDVKKCNYLKIEDWSDPQLASIVTDCSKELEERVNQGTLDDTDRYIVLTATRLCWIHILSQWPVAFAHGETRESRVGVISRLERMVERAIDYYQGYHSYRG